jgi:hypothetical protein
MSTASIERFEVNLYNPQHPERRHPEKVPQDSRYHQ